MNLMPTFAIWQYALAGLCCAAAPLLIHLLTRRHFHRVEWAAMELLREALRRQKRWLRLRDLILLALRTCAVLLLGLALAQPFFSTPGSFVAGQSPIHLILIIDNSLSMASTSLDGSLLDTARQQASDLVDRLPPGSQTTVAAWCGSTARENRQPHSSTADARQALGAIQIVDRTASFPQAIAIAQRAVVTGDRLPARVVIISDGQQTTWRQARAASWPDELPPPSIMNIADSDRQNRWLADLAVADGLADAQAPATIVASIEQTRSTRRASGADNLQVRLRLRGEVVATQMISMSPTETRRTVTFEHTFDLDPDNQLASEKDSTTEFVPISVGISADRLPLDDERHLVVPVVRSLPVVFIDQLSDDEEDARLLRAGDTRHLRRLVAPRVDEQETSASVIDVRHASISEFEAAPQAWLADARVAVMAGGNPSAAAVRWCREYVEQGGQLLIAAGGDFDWRTWHDRAWLDGDGILPAPLIGQQDVMAATAGSTLAPRVIDFESVRLDPLWGLAGVSERDLAALYDEPLFFNVITVDMSADVNQSLLEREVDRLRARWQSLQATGGSPPAENADVATWLAWSGDIPADPTDEALRQLDSSTPTDQRRRMLASLAERSLPQVHGRLSGTESLPLLVERPIGRGNVVFFASDVFAKWNTLPVTNAFLIFDRIIRHQIQSTLARRTFATTDRIDLPLSGLASGSFAQLVRPGSSSLEELDVGFVGGRQRGVAIEKPLDRGIYRVAVGQRESAGPDPGISSQVMNLAVNGPSTESDLTMLSNQEIAARFGESEANWIESARQWQLANRSAGRFSLWKWIVVGLLGVLVGELAFVGWPAWRRSRRASS